MLKVGVVGLRRGWGLLHTFHNHRDAQVVAVCDQAAELRQKASDEFGIEAGYADFAKMLAAELDAIVVATPAPLHAGQSIAAIEAGAHVLSEVPAAWTLDECAALAATVRRTGRTYMMAENMNYFHYLQVWKERIKAGEIGDVFYAEAEYIHDCRTLMRDAAGELTWRASMPPIHYCPHSLGPVLDILDDRCMSVVGMATGDQDTVRFYANAGAGDALAGFLWNTRLAGEQPCAVGRGEDISRRRRETGVDHGRGFSLQRAC